MNRERNTISTLGRAGKVWKHKGYYIIVDKQTTIVYASKDI